MSKTTKDDIFKVGAARHDDLVSLFRGLDGGPDGVVIPRNMNRFRKADRGNRE